MLTISDVTNWGELDIAALEKWINKYANLLEKNQQHRATNCIKIAITIEHGFPVMDINIWFHTTINLIFYHLTNHLKHTHRANRNLMKNIKKLEAEFSPDANAIASSFNNRFDYINFEQPRKEVLKQAIVVLSEG
jgi:hypothetical protein